MSSKQEYLKELKKNIHDTSFSALKDAFENYDYVKDEYGNVTVTSKMQLGNYKFTKDENGNRVVERTGVTDEWTKELVEFANIWFNQITSTKHTSAIYNSFDDAERKKDKDLVDFAFGDVGEETYNKIKDCYMKSCASYLPKAMDKSNTTSNSTFKDCLDEELQNAVGNVSNIHGKNVFYTLSASSEDYASSAGYTPEFFQRKTANFMADAYLSQGFESTYQQVSNTPDSKFGENSVQTDKIKNFVTTVKDKLGLSKTQSRTM